MAVSLLHMQTRTSAGITVRIAELSEAPEITAMQHLSLRTLGRAHYTSAQIESYLRYTPTLEDYLLVDHTYYLASAGDRIVGCGGWSMRTAAYQAVATAQSDAEPHAVPKVRAMFVHPDFARRGVGRSLLTVIEHAIAAAGYCETKVDSTLGGVALYQRGGFSRVQEFHAEFPDGTTFPLLRMYKRLSTQARREDGR